MTRLAAAVLIAAATGACTSTVGPFVKNAWIEGNYLVLEKCSIEYSSPMGGAITERGCYQQQLPLPASVEVSPSPPPSLARPSTDPCAAVIDEWRAQRDLVKKTELYNAMPEHCRERVTRKVSEPESNPSLPASPTREQVLEGLRTVSDDVTACAERAGVTETFTLAFSITPAGRAAHLRLSRVDEALRSCIETAIGSVQFPHSRTGTTVAFPFRPPSE